MEEGVCDELEDVVRAVAQDDLLGRKVEAPRERSLEVEARTVGIARELGGRPRDRRERLGTRPARILVRGELDDRRFVEAELAREVADRLRRRGTRESRDVIRPDRLVVAA